MEMVPDMARLTRQMGRITVMDEENKSRSSDLVRSSISGINTMPPPAPKRPLTAPAQNPATHKPIGLDNMKTPPMESFSKGGSFIQKRELRMQLSSCLFDYSPVDRTMSVDMYLVSIRFAVTASTRALYQSFMSAVIRSFLIM